MHFSGWSGRYASIGRIARGPAPGAGPRCWRPKIRRASDSIVGAGAAAAPPGGFSTSVGSSPSERFASGGALASGSGLVGAFSGGGAMAGGRGPEGLWACGGGGGGGGLGGGGG